MGSLSDVFHNNTCVTADPGSIFAFNDCNEASPNDGHVPIFSHNTYSIPPGLYEFKCGKQVWVRRCFQYRAESHRAYALTVLCLPRPATTELDDGAGHGRRRGQRARAAALHGRHHRSRARATATLNNSTMWVWRGGSRVKVLPQASLFRAGGSRRRGKKRGGDSPRGTSARGGNFRTPKLPV